MEGWQVARVLKRDVFGRIELVEHGGERAVRRVARAVRASPATWIARILLAREGRALRTLAGLAGVPRWIDERGGALLRSYIAGAPLHEAEELPIDFFDRLDELVGALHERGVCHNDLHKEQNVLVGSDGFPALIDFQLASCHRQRGRLYASRARDDLRHVEKHRRRYTRDGRGPRGAATAERGRGHGLARSWFARVWRRRVKPLYNRLTRSRLLRRDGEARRESSGPWPRWTAAVGPRAAGAGREEGGEAERAHRAADRRG